MTESSRRVGPFAVTAGLCGFFVFVVVVVVL